jgi:hypothetical protein
MRKAYVGVLVMMCGLSWPLARASAQTLTPAQVTALQNLLNCVSVRRHDREAVTSISERHKQRREEWHGESHHWL